AANRRSARGVLAVAGWRLRAGRLARAEEPHVELRRPAGTANTRWRRTEHGPARRVHLVAIQEREDDDQGRWRDLLRLARIEHLRTGPACRRVPAAGLDNPEPRFPRPVFWR